MTRHLWRVAGLLSVALGAVGAFVPLLPTVPFLILAAFCFARGAPEWEARLMDHPRYGAHLRNWRAHGVVSRKGKWAATIAFAVSILLALLFSRWPWNMAPPGVAVVTLSWLWTRPESARTE